MLHSRHLQKTRTYRKHTAKVLLRLCLILGGITAFLKYTEKTARDIIAPSKIRFFEENRSKLGDSFLTEERLADSESERQVAFYNNHIAQLQSFIRSTSIMEWHTRGENTFQPLLDSFPVSEFIHNDYDNDNFVSSLPSSGAHVDNRNGGLGGLCYVAKSFQKYWNSSKSPEPRPHVLFTGLNENWGEFSSQIINKTFMWGDLDQNWKDAGCSKESIWAYLDHPDTLLVITIQFQNFYHPKAISIPLGLLSTWTKKMLDTIQQMIDDDVENKTQTREQLLMVNNSPIPTRLMSVNAVNRTFSGTLVNSYGMDVTDYYREMQKFKFILSPAGVGVDCYRNWEAIYMGTIPVIETLNRTDGWFRTFDNLPVAFIDSFENLTPEILEQEYSRIIARPLQQYHYEKMTKQYWIRLIRKTFRHYNHNHNKTNI